MTQNPFTSILSTTFTYNLYKIIYTYELVDGLDDLWLNYLLSDVINHVILLIPTLPRDFVLVNTQGCFTHLIIIPFSYNLGTPNYMKITCGQQLGHEIIPKVTFYEKCIHSFMYYKLLYRVVRCRVWQSVQTFIVMSLYLRKLYSTILL